MAQENWEAEEEAQDLDQERIEQESQNWRFTNSSGKSVF
jgi:hypothetical protein